MKILALLSLLVVSQVWASWSVSTYNIRNFDHDYQAGETNLRELGKNLKAFKSDVMAFVEVVNVNAFEQVVKDNLPGYLTQISNCGGFGKQKLAIAFNPKIFSFVSSAEDMSFSGSSGSKCGSLRPVFLVTLQHKSSKEFYLFAAIHLKAGGAESAMQQRWGQYAKLEKLAARHSEKNLIMLGDFNTTGYNLKNEDFTHFEDLLDRASLKSTSENLACTSYWTGTLGTGQHQSSILDHIVLDKNLSDSVKDVVLGSHCAALKCKDATPEELGVSYQTVSDHCPIQVTFK